MEINFSENAVQPYSISGGFFESFDDKPNSRLTGLYNQIINIGDYVSYGLKPQNVPVGHVVRVLTEIPKNPSQVAHQRVVFDKPTGDGKNTIKDVWSDKEVGTVKLHHPDTSLFPDDMKEPMQKLGMSIEITPVLKQ